jgi:signal transduction histidine kinase
MIEGEAATGEVADCAAKILEQTQNITHVVTEFLKYARPLEISDEAVQLQATVERVVSEISEAHPGVRVRSEGQFGCVAGDEGLLRQALLNLVRNAAEACCDAPNGGRIILRGEVLTSNDGPFQRLLLFDNGPGIPPAVLRKLFRPFFTTKAAGTGLGLAVVQKIIVQHGGSVEAHNRPEGGAAFIVTLPLGRAIPVPVETR